MSQAGASVFATVPLAVFGPGSLYVTRIDIAAQTPVNIGYVQEFSYDESGESKSLYGTNQYPLVVARGTIKATGKAKNAVVSGLALNAVFNGGTFNAGQLLMAQGEAHTIPADVTHPTTADTASGKVLPFTTTTGVVPGISASGTNLPAGAYVVSVVANTSVTLNANLTGDVPSATVITFGPSVVVTNGMDFDTDLGVVYAETNLPFMYVEDAAPTLGQYSVDPDTGAYSFAVADIAAAVLITYAYTSDTGGQTITIMNTPIGNTPVFQIDYSTSLYGNPYYARFYACVSDKLSRAHKLTDFMMPEVDFGFFSLNNGKVYTLSYNQVS